ncbi:protein spaetzle 3 [Coccinella septempunctata]|uniref:protein spaetzle 3 n=1 Tax=Coccinella septempunctata TaxID=41139 RepID=UPI001D08F121|nr:protein spaetzle 3 [Coccinella septempunctata]
MSLLNYSVPSPYYGTPNPATNYYQPPQPSVLPPFPPNVQPYHYPHPQKPFLGEEFPPTHYRGHHTTPQSTPSPPPPSLGYPYGIPTDSNSGTTQVHHSTHHGGPSEPDYDYGEDDSSLVPPVTPIQGPIYVKNGTVPVVPLYSYPVLNNGTLVQIPILWTALSVALGLELRGEYIRGVPCLVRNFQLFCPRAGNTYPLDRIELFIDENKALMKRMYGEFDMGIYPNGPTGNKKKRSAKPGVPDLHFDPGPEPLRGGESFLGKIRAPRQTFRNNQSSETGKVDACQSKVEIITPYWASNSAGKIRAIVNTQHFEQAIHQETCAKVRTNRCSGDCGCEQKYKWHRLLAYDPDNDCKGIFMDWFLFPSCCVCRCNPN